MKKYAIILIILIYCVFQTSSIMGQILDSRILNLETEQYAKMEWQIELLASWNNPYNYAEIALNMNITTPSGEKLILPCYYEKGESSSKSEWRARFAAREHGNYTYWFELLSKGKTVSTTDFEKFEATPSTSKGFLNPNDLWTLRYDNGEMFRGIGENICWESRDVDDSKYFQALQQDSRFNYDYMLTKLAANGGNFFRTWMIYWNLPIDWKTVSNNRRYKNATLPYNESGILRMDQLVALCDSLHIHMMLALESHVGYMGEGWEMSNYNIVNGGNATSPYEFFTLPAAKAQYKNKLRFMVARYGYSPSIGAWEFFNEIDNAMYYGKPEEYIHDSVITQWHNEMSTYLKSIDPYKHIVTTSVSHRDVAGMNDLKNMDINQRHMYKNTDGIPKALQEYSQKHNKPYVIGEAGYDWDWNKNFNEFGNEFDTDFRSGLWYGLFSPTPILPMTWWWEFFENRGMMEYFNRVRTVYDDMMAAGKGKFELFDVNPSNNDCKAYGVKCGAKNFVYLHNTSPANSVVQLNTNQLINGKNNMQVFDCSTGEYKVVAYSLMPDKSIKIDSILTAGKTDIILIWE